MSVLSRYLPVFLSFMIILASPGASALAEASEAAGKASFIKGLALFEDARFEKSIQEFSGSLKHLPVIGDYALLYMAKANNKLGNQTEALRTISRLIAEYPSSPLRRKAAKVVIQSHLKDDWDTAIIHLEKYLASYPWDTEMKFLLGRLYQGRGKAERAASLLRKLYINAGPYDEQSFELLENRSFSIKMNLKRVKNLIKNNKYRSAERALRKLLRHKNTAAKKTMKHLLATVLYHQKQYAEAAGLLEETGQFSLAAKAYLRSGNRLDFQRTIEVMIAQNDPDVVALMAAEATEKYNSDDTAEAIKLLERSVELFPRHSEKAEWYLGWIYYKNKQFDKAAAIFSSMHKKYSTSKYLYWKARAQENAGIDASALFRQIDSDDYYGVLAAAKLNDAPAQIKKKRRRQKPKNHMKRIDTLAEVGLRDEAAHELELKLTASKRPAMLIAVAYKLMEIKSYHRAISLMYKLPNSLRPKEILYPLAYWDTLKSEAGKYGLDPYLMVSLMREESRFNRKALSPAGAMGLMQLMPATARRTAKGMHLRLNTSESILNAETNIRIGTRYFSKLYEKFNAAPTALAAYNAGSSRVLRWLNEGDYQFYDEFIEDVPYRETRNYIKRIITTYYQYLNIFGTPADAMAEETLNFSRPVVF